MNLPSNNSQDDLVTSYDSYGRKLLIPKVRWVREFLPKMVAQSFENPDALAEIIHHSLSNNLAVFVVPAARQLEKIDYDRSRGSCVLAGVLCAVGDIKGAQNVVEAARKKTPDTPRLLTTQAAIFLLQGQAKKAKPLLEYALNLDPNNQTALQWLCTTISNIESKPDLTQDTLRTLTKNEQAWVAPATLAEMLLEERKEEEALALYKLALERAQRLDPNVPADLLTNLTGALCRKALLIEALDLAKPIYNPQVHGLLAGKNIVHAHIDLGQLDQAKEVLETLHCIGRPEWREDLGELEGELAGADLSIRNPSESAVGMELLRVEGPLWLPKSSPARKLLPRKDPQEMMIGFLGSSLEDNSNYKHGSVHLSSLPGQLARAIPIWLSELVWLRSKAQTLCLCPCTYANEGGFVLTNGPWVSDLICHAAREQSPACDYLVVSHIKATQVPWEVSLEVLRTIDAKSLGKKAFTISPEEGGEGLWRKSSKLLRWIIDSAEVEEEEPLKKEFEIPPENFSHYVIGLEQALGVLAGTRKGATLENVINLRGLLSALLHTCLAIPESVPPRLLLAQCLHNLEKKKPAIVGEFKEKYHLLTQEFPFSKEIQKKVSAVWG